jgi:hypothetical protein
MSSVEVLAPLRIETRFYPPDGEHEAWRLRLRVYPDEFSIARQPPPPSPQELDLFDEALRNYPADGDTQLRVLAARLGMERAIWLRRTVAIDTVDGVPRTDRAGAQARDPAQYPPTHKPYGLPPTINVWLLKLGDTTPTLAATMYPDRDRIADGLDLKALATSASIEDGELPPTWWTSFDIAMAVGLAIEIAFPADEPLPELEAIVVSGLGDKAPGQLIATHAATGRLAVLKPGMPTNTVDGEPTAEMGADPSAWQSIDNAPPDVGSASSVVIGTLCGSDADPFRLQGGDTPAAGHAPVLVRALWPVLWGHALRDMIGVGAAEADLAEWAADHLAPEGPYPAIRVGTQPYGLLPTTLLSDWIDGSATEQHIRAWSMGWRDAAAADASVNPGSVVGASAEQAVAFFGLDAPTTRWGVRPLSTLSVVNAMQVLAGLPLSTPTPWEQDTAASLAGASSPVVPLAPFERVFALPSSTPDGSGDDPETLRLLLEADSEAFPYRWERKLGLLGHLIFDTLCLLRASVGQARTAIDAGQPVDPAAPLPLQLGTDALITLVRKGYAGAAASPHLNDLLAADAGAQQVAERYLLAVKALATLVDAYGDDPDGVFACLQAALDTASHRVDPWITGIADARLRQMGVERAPFWLGAYGWVDRPAPYDAASPGHGLPPGPTAAGLLHAPSQAQAMTAALLRDAAVRYPGDTRWNIAIDSAKVRAATRLAERVRLGVHPYEALGLEVERIIGDWDTVRVLRQQYPLRDSHQGQRCCDGAHVLRLLFRPQPGDPPPPAISADARQQLQTYDAALDTYADLLIADGIHALVSGQGGVGNAAMEAAAGLGAPSDLRAIRTPRNATTVRVSAWALLPPGDASAINPALCADPAFAQLLDTELGPPQGWTWTVGAQTVSLTDRGLHGAAILALNDDELAQSLRGGLDPALPLQSTGGAEKLARANRLAELLGGGDSNPPVPDPDNGRDDARAPDSALRTAMLLDLATRLDTLKGRLQTLVAAFDVADLNDPAVGPWFLAQFRAWQAVATVDEEPLAQARARLQLRLAAAAPAQGVNALRLAIRALTGNARLPVLPIVDANLLTPMTTAPADADGRPETDRTWLEIVAAVRPRLALLEALQLDPGRTPWGAAVRTGDGSGDPWTVTGPVVVAYGPDPAAPAGSVAITGLDAWQDAVPASQHVTSAAFGFNGPKSRPPQAVLLAVPPDPGQRLSEQQLAAVVLDTRQLARARASRPRIGNRVATPGALSSFPSLFWQKWT